MTGLGLLQQFPQAGFLRCQLPKLIEGLDALPEVIRHIETYDVTTIRASTPMFLLARRIVQGKIENSRNVLRRFRKHAAEEVPLEEIRSVESVLPGAQQALSLESLLGLEGTAAARAPIFATKSWSAAPPPPGAPSSAPCCWRPPPASACARHSACSTRPVASSGTKSPGAVAIGAVWLWRGEPSALRSRSNR